mmetsp:Transcript_35831/g.66284  ORF Transcript_35831/g.66284 Transcript_35831/m.66284 type:complete len:497 (-) Transcript_35831:317-1807(-)|eukprot:CAMPEP_0170182488 /NCGR_PEP_ID=MMETSP0040_2-20121228/28012_1 /TAXON_ID=641309 /ORGANISM="Lotharella oceanica, Strain CCMP622" /LENGTH=496 /DNA_ID=CAMNT_0010427919 /DNA_START=80 /DNA_END=1570 /DNA_ORIENTATION=-
MILGLDTRKKQLIFVGYVLTWSVHKLLIHYKSREDLEEQEHEEEGYHHQQGQAAHYRNDDQHHDEQHQNNNLVIVMNMAVLKIVLGVVVYVTREGTFTKLMHQIRKYRWLVVPFMIPSGLYMVVDALALVILSHVDPRTFTMLSSLKIVMMGIVWSTWFNKHITQIQWAGLVCITGGCVLDQAAFIMGHVHTLDSTNHGHHDDYQHGSSSNAVLTSPSKSNITTTLLLPSRTSSSSSWFGPIAARMLILVEIVVVVLAAVYFERLVKRYHQISINVLNMYMYLNSLALGFLYHFLMAIIKYATTTNHPYDHDDKTTATHHNDLASFPSLRMWMLDYEWKYWMVVALSAWGGFLTSLFMKHLDSVRKTIAMACQMVCDAVLAFFVLNIPLKASTVVSSSIVGVGVVFYSYGMRPAKKAKTDERIDRNSRSPSIDVEGGLRPKHKLSQVSLTYRVGRPDGGTLHGTLHADATNRLGAGGQTTAMLRPTSAPTLLHQRT